MTRGFIALLLIALLSACNALSDGPPTRQVTAPATPEPVRESAETSPAQQPDADPTATASAAQPSPGAIPTRVNSVSCDDAPASRIIVQERAQVTYNNERLNLRNGPGTEFRVLLLMEPGTVMLVADGPVCGETYTWYRVVYRNREGWVAEGDLNEYYIRPYLPG